jgi:hypothetical protein
MDKEKQLNDIKAAFEAKCEALRDAFPFGQIPAGVTSKIEDDSNIGGLIEATVAQFAIVGLLCYTGYLIVHHPVDIECNE